MLGAAFRHRKKTDVAAADVWRRRQQRHNSVVRETSKKVKRTAARFAAFLEDCELDPSWPALRVESVLRKLDAVERSLNKNENDAAFLRAQLLSIGTLRRMQAEIRSERVS